MQDNIKPEKIWLVGTGSIAPDYAKVLQAQGVAFTTVGRGSESAEQYTQKTGLPVVTGGVSKALAVSAPEAAIVAVSVSELADVTCSLLSNGVKQILLEKPGGKDVKEVAEVADAAKKSDAEVMIAYNRRFYASTLAAEKIIQQDGGVTSFNFEFTEWLHVFKSVEKYNDEQNQNIFLSNSTHVIDMAFFLGGFPKNISCYAENKEKLFDKNAVRIYTGAGITDKGALFSYGSNWHAPGRWSVEVMTRNHRFIFKPLEQLQIQKMRTVEIEKIQIDDSLDKEYKPGLYREVKAFITGEGAERFPNIHEQLANCEIYKQMRNGM